MSSNNNNEIKSIEDWTVEDVGNWLINAGYGKYKELFFENDIDGQVLVELNEFHLKTELNIKSLGERIKLYKLIKGLKSNNINNQNIKSENPKDFKSEIQNEIHNSKIINNNSENNNVNNIPTNINESYIKNKFKANSNNKTNSNNLINSINIKQDKKNSSLLEYRIKPLKFSKKVYQKLFLPKNGIKNSYLLPEHYSLNEIPSFYYYSKIKLNKSMYSRFIQKMIFRMLRNRVTYINNQKSDHPSYVWKPFGNKFEVYYLFEKSDNEWKGIS
ncbi:hypothetical protein BCR36DRAFT_396929 [Piromyces finnis]|uniref:SAM domain-containing protein n=1 Tax=Piromyces finnis TaxID=1754191 RepID=A0A1Y1VBJ4_9FUNG|nr:hypothetical protein BCR36DRAFT_396929 [Piromyces finnis]|eukprot:ORX52126.1 hypothetical protein BCR36DRAFT_396929 [Piromyces finnis]